MIQSKAMIPSFVKLIQVIMNDHAKIFCGEYRVEKCVKVDYEINCGRSLVKKHGHGSK